jgi:hypothetical protein
MILFAAIGGLLALMGGIVYYSSLDIPLLELAEIKLAKVEVVDVNSIENRVRLETTFLVKNPSDKTFTVPLISYELFANGKSLGTGQYSTEDIAMPGRAAFYPGVEIPLKSPFQFVLSDTITEEYKAIAGGENVQYSVKGMITVETAWSLIEKEFQSTL